MNLVQALYLNNDVKPFDNEKVRQAMCYAVNVDEHPRPDRATATAPRSAPPSILPSPSTLTHSLADAYPYDRGQGQSSCWLTPGMPMASAMTITVPSNYTPHVNVAQVLVEQLAAVGITATIKPVEWETWVSATPITNRNFESHGRRLRCRHPDARALMLQPLDERQSDKNMINYSNNPEYDKVHAGGQRVHRRRKADRAVQAG